MTHGKRAERGRQDGTSRTAQLPLVTQQVVLCTVFFNFKSVELYSNPGSERKADAKRSPHLVDGQQSLPALNSIPTHLHQNHREPAPTSSRIEPSRHIAPPTSLPKQNNIATPINPEYSTDGGCTARSTSQELIEKTESSRLSARGGAMYQTRTNLLAGRRVARSPTTLTTCLWGRHKRDYVGIGEVNPSVARMADAKKLKRSASSFLPPSKRGSTVFQQVALELCLGTHACESIRAPTRAEGNQAANTKRRKQIDNLKPKRSAEHTPPTFPSPLPPTTFYATHTLGNLKPSRSCLFFTHISRVRGDLTRLQKTKKTPPY